MISKITSISYFFVIIFLINPMLAMEWSTQEALPPLTKACIVIKDYYGKVIPVHKDDVEKIDYIQGKFHFSPDSFPFFFGEGKEASFDAEDGRKDYIEIIPDINFYKKPLDTRIGEKIKPTAKVIKMLVKCVNEQHVKSLTKERMKAVATLADYFGIPNEGYRYIASRLEESADVDEEIHGYMLEYGGISVASLQQKLFQEREKEKEDDQALNAISIETFNKAHYPTRKILAELKYSISFIKLNNKYNGFITTTLANVMANLREKNFLWLEDKKLETLYGINNFEGKEDIECLNIAKNKVTKLDVSALIKVFPKLKCIIASGNPCLTTLILPHKLPDDFGLILNGCPIQIISPFKAGEDCTLRFSEHFLSKEAKKVIEASNKPNFFEQRRHYPFFAKRIALAAVVGATLGGCYGLTAFGSKNLNNNNHTTLPYCIEEIVRALAYCVVKVTQLSGGILEKKIKEDLEATEFTAKLFAIGGMVLLPIAPNFVQFLLPASMQGYVANYYGDYPVYYPAIIIMDEEIPTTQEKDKKS